MALDVVALTRRLIRFDTINPPGREAAAMRCCGDLLEAAGFRVEIIDHGDARASLIATRNAVPGQALWFSGHLDTVPLGRAPWSVPPHEAQIDGDLMFGRGSSDMKGGIAAFLVACAEAAPVAGGLGVVLSAGEETGCDGARWLAEAGVLPKAGAMIVGESTDNQPLAGHKGALWLRLYSEGRTTHGATPDLGVNAIARMAPTLVRLVGYDPAVRHPVMGRATCNIGTLRAGINPNSVPDLCEATADLRSVEGVTHAELTAAVAALCDDTVQIETLLDLPAVWTDPETRWVWPRRRTGARLHGRRSRPLCANYFTDASILTPAMGNPPVMILGPGSVDQPHSTDEYVRLSRLHEAVAVYASLISDWEGA